MSRNQSNCWGHTVTLRPVSNWQYLQWCEVKYGGHFNEWRCRAITRGKCLLPTTHVVGFNYVTGRQGRVSRMTRAVCFKHALAFAKRHDLEIQTIERTGELAVS